MLSRTLRPAAARLASCTFRPVFSTPAIEPLRIRTFITSPARPSPEVGSQSSSSSPIPPTSADPIAAVSQNTEVETETPQLPYYVARNNLQNLGVYQLTKAGGNRQLTLLKHAEGDMQALKEDIRAALDLPPGAVSYNSVTKHIQIKGHQKHRLMLFLKTVGF